MLAQLTRLLWGGACLLPRSQLVGLLAFQTLPTREVVAVWQLLTMFLTSAIALIVLIAGFTAPKSTTWSNTTNLLIAVAVSEGVRLLAMLGLWRVNGRENLATL